MKKIGSLLILALVSRISFIIINTFGICFCLVCLKNIIPLIFHPYTDAELHAITITLNGIAGMFVGLGVVYECRETILKMATKEISHQNEYLNLVAEQDGVGILVVGLFMEIITISLEIPNKILDTSGVEFALLILCSLFVILALIFQLDLTKDYLKTFFKKIKHEEK